MMLPKKPGSSAATRALFVPRSCAKAGAATSRIAPAIQHARIVRVTVPPVRQLEIGSISSPKDFSFSKPLLGPAGGKNEECRFD
jgi:hypothetical protein